MVQLVTEAEAAVIQQPLDCQKGLGVHPASTQLKYLPTRLPLDILLEDLVLSDDFKRI